MIKVEHLVKKFGLRTAVDDVSFEVDKGTVLGVLGPNGAGKTTSIRMIAGYLPPTAGTVSVNGVDVVADPVAAQKQIGYMPENTPLYDEMTVAWVSKDHPVAAYDEVTLADLADETLLTDLDAVAIDRVNAGAVLLVPMSVARSASRRDLVHRPVTDAEPTSISLAWRTDNEHPLIDEFIGIVRGRTANSSRTQAERAASTPKPKPQRLSSPGKRPGNAPRPPKVRKKRR